MKKILIAASLFSAFSVFAQDISCQAGLYKLAISQHGQQVSVEYSLDGSLFKGPALIPTEVQESYISNRFIAVALKQTDIKNSIKIIGTKVGRVYKAKLIRDNEGTQDIECKKL